MHRDRPASQKQTSNDFLLERKSLLQLQQTYQTIKGGVISISKTVYISYTLLLIKYIKFIYLNTILS